MFTPNEKNPRPSCNSTEGDGNYLAADTDLQPTDVTTLSNAEWDRCMDYYRSGYMAGLDRGRALADAEAAAIGREAARIVHLMAGIPERDREADKARRARIDARFNERRPA
ncbi:hypothetical protein NYE39_02220 [Janibacter sp. FSL W8-0316]|uniref:hypothetical protein n=1 Tax=Janibacter sp. FSL W8-0316 TaxID=2975325 RepID=UPI0030FC4BB5